MDDDMEEFDGSAEYVKYAESNGAVRVFVLAFAEADTTLRRQISERLRLQLLTVLRREPFEVMFNGENDIWVIHGSPVAKHAKVDKLVRSVMYAAAINIISETTVNAGHFMGTVLLRAGTRKNTT